MKMKEFIRLATQCIDKDWANTRGLQMDYVMIIYIFAMMESKDIVDEKIEDKGIEIALTSKL